MAINTYNGRQNHQEMNTSTPARKEMKTRKENLEHMVSFQGLKKKRHYKKHTH